MFEILVINAWINTECGWVHGQIHIAHESNKSKYTHERDLHHCDGKQPDWGAKYPSLLNHCDMQHIALNIFKVLAVSIKVRLDYTCSCCTDSELPVCTDSCSTDNADNPSSPWLQLIARKPSTFTEAHERQNTWVSELSPSSCFRRQAKICGQTHIRKK